MTLRKRPSTMRGTGPIVMPLPPDEQPEATPAPLPKERNGRGLFTKGNRAGSKTHRPNITTHISDPVLKSCKLWGERARTARCRELAAAHGGKISNGVRELVELACRAGAHSRYLAHLAEQNADPNMLKLSARLGETSRQHHLAAWELAAREAKVNPPQEKNAYWDKIQGVVENDEPTEAHQEPTQEEPPKKMRVE